MPGAHQSRSITPPPQLGRGEKYNKKLAGQGKDRRVHSPITVTGKTDLT